MRTDSDISIDEAANFLNLSAAFITQETNEGRLPVIQSGEGRRILFEDLRAYAGELRQRQECALEHMAEEARELGLNC